MKSLNISFLSKRFIILKPPSTFQDLKLQITQSLQIDDFSINYQDCENDMIAIYTEEEYQSALQSTKEKTLNLFVNEKSGNAGSDQNLKNDESFEIIDIETSDVEPEILSEESNQFINLSDKLKDNSQNDKIKTNNSFSDLDYSIILDNVRDVLRQEISKRNAKLRDSLAVPVHKNFKCNGCALTPIRGSRYHCTKCNLNYCEICEENTDHEHPLLKFKKPSEETTFQSQNYKGNKPNGKELFAAVTKLKEIGFTNEKKNFEYLIKCGFDLNSAIAKLKSL